MEKFTGSGQEWNALIASLPNPHLLQTWEWSQVKAAYGWQALPFTWDDGAAMLLKRQVLNSGLAARLSILYAPKGPGIGVDNVLLYGRILDDMQAFCRRTGAILLKIDPDVVVGAGVPGEADAIDIEAGLLFEAELRRRGWLSTADQVQFRNTVMIDLSASEEVMLQRMKQKTRYNIRLAEKKGVRIRGGNRDDLPGLYRMYVETSIRDGFVIRSEAYYRAVWEMFMRAPSGPSQPFTEPLVAEVDGEAVAAIFVFYFAGRAYYLYGMSRQAHRDKMPNYLLQWEAMKRARAYGCTMYDLWGAPDEFDEGDPMWGVFRFKEGLGGQVVRTIGAWDYPASPLWYKTYTQVIPRVLNVMRAHGQAQTERAIE